MNKLCLAGVCLAAVLSVSAAPVTLTVDTAHPGAAVSPDFTGLSFETSVLLPENGTHYFRPDNQRLITLFHTLDIKSLRIGGNTGDRDWRRSPAEADIDSLFAFAKAADVKVIYCLRLRGGDPQEDARTAKYIMDRYRPLVEAFSIGQEPSAYPRGDVPDNRPATERMGAGNEKYPYSAYRDAWKIFADAIIAAVPDVKFAGPGVHNNADWARRFMDDYARGHHVAMITEHLYAGGAGGKVPTPEIGRDRMLSTNFIRAYEKLHDGFVPQAISNSLPYRLEEANNYFNGGATNVSNTYASALWGLDFMWWWAEHDAAGINFHTGDRVAAGYTLRPSKYTAFFSTTNGYVIRPLAYGIKMFGLGAHGHLLPLTVDNSAGLNLTARAVMGDDQSVYVTIINKEHDAGAQSAEVTLSPGAGFNAGSIISLTAPGNDVSLTTGETLGGAAIQSDGSWSGAWTPLAAPFSVTLAPASAVVVRLERSN